MRLSKRKSSHDGRKFQVNSYSLPRSYGQTECFWTETDVHEGILKGKVGEMSSGFEGARFRLARDFDPSVSPLISLILGNWKIGSIKYYLSSG